MSQSNNGETMPKSASLLSSTFYLSAFLLTIAPFSSTLCMREKVYQKGASLLCRNLSSSLKGAPTVSPAIPTRNNLPQPQNSIFGKIMDNFGKSEFMIRYNADLAFRHPSTAPFAPEKIQQMAYAAQLVIGIKKDKVVPIRINNNTPVLAAGPGYIFLNEAVVLEKNPPEKPNNGILKPIILTYGDLRCSLLHEGSHINYNDAAISHYIRTEAQKVSPSRAQLWLSINEKHLLNCERRADIESFYASECHVCVSERATDMRKSTNNAHENIRKCEPVINNPDRYTQASRDAAPSAIKEAKYFLAAYAKPEEADTIAAHLKAENKLCDYHRAEQETSSDALHKLNKLTKQYIIKIGLFFKAKSNNK